MRRMWRPPCCSPAGRCACRRRAGGRAKRYGRAAPTARRPSRALGSVVSAGVQVELQYCIAVLFLFAVKEGCSAGRGQCTGCAARRAVLGAARCRKLVT